MIKVAMLDDHPLILSGMKAILDIEADIRVTGTYHTSSLLLSDLHRELPDVLLLDLQLQQETGDAVLQLLQKEYSSIRVIILTNIDAMQVVRNLMTIGARGYMLKTSPLSKLPEAIRMVAGGAVYIADEIKEVLARTALTADRSHQTNSFSSRETEILQLISEEYTTQEIAMKLGLSNRTIDNYRLGLMQKLDAKNMIGMVKKAILLGLIK